MGVKGSRPVTFSFGGSRAKTWYCAFLLAALLVAILLALPLPTLASPPQTAILRWARVDTPGGFADRNDIRSPCEVNAIVVASDGRIVYAIDIPNAAPAPVAVPGLWESSDGGISWSAKPTEHLVGATPAPTLPVMDVVVAPDDPKLLAVVCLNGAGTLRREVYLSGDGGDSWDYSGAVSWVFGGGEQIGDIAISHGYNLNDRLTHDIIVGSRNPADGNGQGEVYILNYPGFGDWKAQGFTGGDAIAVRCSPNYIADFTLVVMAATTGQTGISLGRRDIVADACVWNTDIGWPVEMCQPNQCGGNASGEDRVITGDIALPLDFSGTDEAKRVIFATYDSNETATGITQVLDDVYRFDNTRVSKLKVPAVAALPG